MNSINLRLMMCALLSGTAASGPASAALESAQLFIDQVYTQTGATTSVPKLDAFAADIFAQSATDFTSVSLSYPGAGSPVSTPFSPTPLGGGIYLQQIAEQAFSSLSALNATFPLGTYAFTATSAAPSQTQEVSLSYSSNDFPSSVPMLSSASYDALQGMNAFSSQTLQFNTSTVDGSGSGFFFIYDASGTDLIYEAPSFPLSAGSAVIPAGTLQPGTDYQAFLSFDNYDYCPSGSSCGSTTSSVVQFQNAEFVAFATAPAAVPEPGTLSLVGLGLVGLGLLRRRRVN